MRLGVLFLILSLVGSTRGNTGPACADSDSVVLSYRRLPDGSASPLDRQTIGYGSTRIEATLAAGCAEGRSVQHLAVEIGARELCATALSSCEIDFGDDLNPWTFDVTVRLLDESSGENRAVRRTVTTLDAGLHTPTSRAVRSASEVALEERSRADRIPYDEIVRTALVLGRDGRPRRGLTEDAFTVSVSGVRDAELIEAVPMSRVSEPRLLFLLVEVSDYLTRTRAGQEWNADYGEFVRTLLTSLDKVRGDGRRLLVVRYSSGAEASPLVDLEAEGLDRVAEWLRRPPAASWRGDEGDRHGPLLRAYDVFLHDFVGQPLGLVISGGRNEGPSESQSAALSQERLRELNPLWPEEYVSALLAELDGGRVDLFPHTEQRGFPLSWVYLPIRQELTSKKFAQAADYFHGFGGEVYRLTDIRASDTNEGQRPKGGALYLDDILLRLFDELESGYRLVLRIPNPRQQRDQHSIRIRVEDSVIRTQTFYRPSASLQANVASYLGSRFKQRRFRAAYAARGYPLDDRIREALATWLPQEPSSQVRRVLEESRLLIEFKRCQAADRRICADACTTLLTMTPDGLTDENRRLLDTLRGIAREWDWAAGP